ncbi:MAG: hypothetical protein M1839_000906 [Geoglossum umbratile]|nr:MAG: hypothetical protein M1839_000906 [Geoglossum umbratile]
MPHIEPHLKTPICQSTRTSKPSARKRANSESISQPPPSSQHAKKACTVTALPINPQRRQIAPNNIDDEEQFNKDEDAASTVIDDDAMDAMQPKEVLDECLFELQHQQDFLDALKVLKMWYTQHKRIIVLLVNWQEKEWKRSIQAQQTFKLAEDILSTTNQLLQTLIAAVKRSSGPGGPRTG